MNTAVRTCSSLAKRSKRGKPNLATPCNRGNPMQCLLVTRLTATRTVDVGASKVRG